MKRNTTLSILSAACLLAAGCNRNGPSTSGPVAGDASLSSLNTHSAPHHFDPYAVILDPHTGTNRVDQEIQQWQQKVQRGLDPNRSLERLGWAFVAKARASFDPRYYALAEECARCLDSRQPGGLEALLLRGHALHNQHRFKEAEPLAKELITRRGLPADYGLLGDVLMEQGQLNPAIDAYQAMIDLRPDLHSYARGAHVRWLKGDLTGALELIRMAVSASSPLDPESSAWVHTRLALYQFQTGAFKQAKQACDAALQYQKDYAPALLLRGRMLLAEGLSAEALGFLQRAVRLNPLPEYQWAITDALREENREDEAQAMEAQLRQTGANRDPRTLALFLATRGHSPNKAVRLAEEELKQRADIFTHDALAWAHAAAGRLPEARRHLEKALAEGTQDARLFFHAAIIFAKAGSKAEARRWLEKAVGQIHMLLPSEQRELQAAALDSDEEAAARGTLPTIAVLSDFPTRGP